VCCLFKWNKSCTVAKKEFSVLILMFILSLNAISKTRSKDGTFVSKLYEGHFNVYSAACIEICEKYLLLKYLNFM